jgi:transcription antitermination factor NusG
LDSLANVTTFLPLLKETHQWSDRKKQVEVPLFSCYVFVRSVYSPEIRHAVLRYRGVVDFVGTGGQALPIPDSEIDSIRRLLASGMPLMPHPYLGEGQRVRIRGGALNNIEGVVITNESRKLIVSVDMISRSVAVRLEGCAYELEPVRRGACGARDTAYMERAWR